MPDLRILSLIVFLLRMIRHKSHRSFIFSDFEPSVFQWWSHEATVSNLIKGSFSVSGVNHGKPTYKKDDWRKTGSKHQFVRDMSSTFFMDFWWCFALRKDMTPPNAESLVSAFSLDKILELWWSCIDCFCFNWWKFGWTNSVNWRYVTEVNHLVYYILHCFTIALPYFTLCLPIDLLFFNHQSPFFVRKKTMCSQCSHVL